jgi:large subunit ribosomal protein L35
MAYKFKPNKSIAKRFRVTAKGKLKRRHTLSTHLRSRRSGNKKRHLGRPAIVSETQARRLRKLIGVTKHPGRPTAKAETKG